MYTKTRVQKPIDRVANESESERERETEGEGECIEIRYLPVGNVRATRINLDDQFLSGRILVAPCFFKDLEDWIRGFLSLTSL